jgi:glycosyl transferase family 25
MKALVINLARSVGRREAMMRQFAGLPLSYDFFPGVDAATGEHRSFSNFIGEAPGRNGRPLTAGEVGCFASHYLAWKECVAGGQSIVVMEDDIVLHPGAVEAWQLAERTLPERTYVRLCGLLPRPFTAIAQLDGYRLVRYLKGPSGGQAYALSPEGARRLLAKAQRWTEPLDDYLDRFWFHGVACLGLLPYRIAPVPTPSDIGARAGYTVSQKLRRKMHHLPDGFRRAVWNLRHV